MFTVLFSPNGTDQPRLGLAIGKQNCRLSTGRNRLKRIVRESFRQQRKLGGMDVVVINQPAASRASNRALFDSLDSHWKRCSGARTGKSEAGKA
jgi:ribonuclease P protein component